jgi:hypothetical protein
MTSERGADGRPPAPPEIDRRLRLVARQYLKLTLIVMVPVLSLVGVFNERWATSTVAGRRIEASVRYPTQFRAQPSAPLIVLIRNRSTAALDTVDVIFDPSYVERFGSVSFTPPPREAYVVSLAPLRPGASRRVHVEVQGDQVGRNEGRVAIRGNGDSASVPIHTLVLP